MKPFLKSVGCKRRICCVHCRDASPSGDTWRRDMAQTYEMPVGSPGLFPCPRGVGVIKIHVSGTPYPIPDDFDPEQEKRRLRQGGCCGKPSA